MYAFLKKSLGRNNFGFCFFTFERTGTHAYLVRYYKLLYEAGFWTGDEVYLALSIRPLHMMYVWGASTHVRTHATAGRVQGVGRGWRWGGGGSESSSSSLICVMYVYTHCIRNFVMQFVCIVLGRVSFFFAFFFVFFEMIIFEKYKFWTGREKKKRKREKAKQSETHYSSTAVNETAAECK